MDEDLYLLALGAVRHHLDQSGQKYELDDGDLLLHGHRLGFSVNFDKFEFQAGQVIAPLDVQIYLDGDDGDRFRVGTLGMGPSREAAMRDAVNEWHLLAASPVLAALGAGLEKRRPSGQPAEMAGWGFYPGRIGLRGSVPPDLQAGGRFYPKLLDAIRQFVSDWSEPNRFELRSVFVMTSAEKKQAEVQAAVNGFLDVELTKSLGALPWPATPDAYFYKQLFVLRGSSDE